MGGSGRPSPGSASIHFRCGVPEPAPAALRACPAVGWCAAVSGRPGGCLRHVRHSADSRPAARPSGGDPRPPGADSQGATGSGRPAAGRHGSLRIEPRECHSGADSHARHREGQPGARAGRATGGGDLPSRCVGAPALDPGGGPHPVPGHAAVRGQRPEDPPPRAGRPGRTDRRGAAHEPEGADGTVSVDVFAVPGSGATPAYGELTRRLDETTTHQLGDKLVDLLATRPAGPVRTVIQTGEFAEAYKQFEVGNFADAGRIAAPAARTVEFENFRGERVRMIEIISPISGGAAVRRAVVLAQPSDRELWEETNTTVRPASYLRTDVEVVRSRETRTTAGAQVGTRSTSAPIRFSLER